MQNFPNSNHRKVPMTNVTPRSLSRLLQDNLPSIVQAGIKRTHVKFFKTWLAQCTALSSLLCLVDSIIRHESTQLAGK
jgi:hypothetical protein